MKTYLSPTGVNLVDEFGNFVKKNRVNIPSHIERDGYYFRNLKEKKLTPHKFYDDNIFLRSISKDYTIRPDLYKFNKEYTTLVKETDMPTAYLHIHLKCEKQNKD